MHSTCHLSDMVHVWWCIATQITAETRALGLGWEPGLGWAGLGWAGMGTSAGLGWEPVLGWAGLGWDGPHGSTPLTLKYYLKAVRTARVRFSDDLQTVLHVVIGHTALDVYKTLNGEVPVVSDGVSDMRSKIDVETLRLFDHQYDIFPLEVAKNSGQSCLRRLERRCAADEVRASVAADSVVETRPRDDWNWILNNTTVTSSQNTTVSLLFPRITVWWGTLIFIVKTVFSQRINFRVLELEIPTKHISFLASDSADQLEMFIY